MWPLSEATLWGLAAAVPAVTAEYLYRTLPGPWWHYLYLWVPMQLSIGYFIYRLVAIPNTALMDAFIVWAFSTTFMRVAISTVLLHDHVKGGTWFALGLLIMARIAQSFWGR
jgi:hypothetical protein